MNEPGAFASIKTEFAKIRSLPKGKRLEYIWEYYRLGIFLTAFSLFFLCMIGTFLFNSITNALFPKEPISIAFATASFTNNEAWMDGCLTAIGYDEKHEKLQTLATAPYSDVSEDFRISTTVWFVNGQPDIFIVDEHSFAYLQDQQTLANLTECWPQELLQLSGNRMAGDFGVDITGTPFAEAYGLTDGPVYLCMYLHGSGFTRALDIVEYILTEG